MRILHLLYFILISVSLSATNISGIVNKYAPVTATSSNTVTIGAMSPAHTFACGDRVLIIQMKGASISTTNDATFGNISAINNAGNYEMATVSSVSGSTLTFTENLSQSYTVSSLVQLVYVPHYEDATVTAKLTAKAWDGTTGGVLAIEVDGTLTLNADIDVSELGFRGGNYHPNTQTSPAKVVCANFGFFKTYQENVGDGFAYNNANKRYAVEKGESISTHNTFLWGKGKLATGGGGGGVESGGGGGGSNYGNGGKGANGNPLSTGALCPNVDVGGIGGSAINTSISTSRVFMGGGSGAGCNGNINGYYTSNAEKLPAIGRNGGGIILISANEIVGGSNNINANGEDGYTQPNVSIDNYGGSGGGAGGSVLLDVNIFTSNLNVNSNGGKGTTVRTNATNNRRRAAGGGGGGGLIYFSKNATPVNVTANANGGSKGLSYYSQNTAAPSHNGTDGGAGGILFNFTISGSNYFPKNLITATGSKTNNVHSTNFVTFSNSGVLASINSNGNDLGSTTVTVTTGTFGPTTSTGCTEDEYYLGRKIDITPTAQPTSACDVSLYFTAAELSAFVSHTNAQTTAYKNCWGAVNNVNDLIVSVFHSDGSAEVVSHSVELLSCANIYKFDVQVSKFSTFYIHSKGGTYGANVLPVEWIAFDAQYITKDQVELNWATATEINNDGFAVERSYNGEDFEEIAWVNGKGNYSRRSDYNYVDKIDIYKNYAHVYYRLKQQDYNGETEYSKIAALKIKQHNFIGELYPNPTNKTTAIDIVNNTDSKCSISVYNAIGKRVYFNSIQKTESSRFTHEIDLSNQNQGVYTCVIEINGEKTIRRLIKK